MHEVVFQGRHLGVQVSLSGEQGLQSRQRCERSRHHMVSQPFVDGEAAFFEAFVKVAPLLQETLECRVAKRTSLRAGFAHSVGLPAT